MQYRRVDQVRKAVDDRLGQQILARQFFQRRPRDFCRAGLRHQHRILQRQRQQELIQRLIVLDVALGLAVLDLVQRWLGDVDVAAFDEFGHLPVEEGQQQVRMWAPSTSASVMMIRAVIAQLFRLVLVLADPGAKRGNQGDDFLRRNQLVETRFLDVEDLSLERQDGLEFPVAPLFRRTAGGITLDQIEFAQAPDPSPGNRPVFRADRRRRAGPCAGSFPAPCAPHREHVRLRRSCR
jgi:hypothetical protein